MSVMAACYPCHYCCNYYYCKQHYYYVSKGTQPVNVKCTSNLGVLSTDPFIQTTAIYLVCPMVPVINEINLYSIYKICKCAYIYVSKYVCIYLS